MCVCVCVFNESVRFTPLILFICFSFLKKERIQNLVKCLYQPNLATNENSNLWLASTRQDQYDKLPLPLLENAKITVAEDALTPAL